jgi:hypothetical protein
VVIHAGLGDELAAEAAKALTAVDAGSTAMPVVVVVVAIRVHGRSAIGLSHTSSDPTSVPTQIRDSSTHPSFFDL